MRGKDDDLDEIDYWDGITPAYAGKSPQNYTLKFKTPDHPRLCGEKFDMMKTTGKVKGSPPPMRGKVFDLPKQTFQDRITPAYAGKSRRITSSFSSMRDHPRLCGEKLCFVCCRGLAAGSPPPMRGKAFGVSRCRSYARITPAYAGKSCPMRCVRFLLWDHPRLCGEK